MPDLLERLKSALADRYAIVREIGHGAMAVVFLAEDLRHHRLVAIKVLHPELGAAVGAERFLQEIETVAGLTHPHILPLHDSGETEGLLFYVMPYVEGESLRQLLEREKQVPLEEALRITREVADALDYAHRSGVIHRDIKPGNILLEEGHAVVTDFGVARAITEAGGDKLTATGLAVGTPTYISPEQIGGEEVDGRSDIYSLGCVLYEMLVGEPPFRGPSVQALISQHLQAPPDLGDPLRGLPPEVVSVLATCLEKDPDDRFSSAGELSKTQWEQTNRGGVVTVAHGPSQLISKRVNLAAALAVGLVLIGAVLSVGIGRRSPPAVRVSGDIVIAVAPMKAAGSDETDAASDLTRELSSALETVPGLSVTEMSDPVPADVRAAASAASEHNARYLVAGSVLGGDGTVSLSIRRYAAEGGEPVVWRGDATSAEETLSEVGRIALEIARDIAERERLDLQGSRGLLYGTSSAAALGHAIQGQARFQSEDFVGAANAFSRSIQADSSFILAYHRMSLAHVWLWDYSAALSAAEAGLERGSPVGAPEIGLLEAQRHYVRQHADSAIASFQLVVLADSSNVDAWLGLAESLYHFAGVTGQCVGDALPAFEQVIRIQPDFGPIYSHLVSLALYAGDSIRTRDLLAKLGEAERPVYELATAIRFGSPVERQSALEQVREGSRQTLSGLVYIFGAGGFDLGLADTLSSFLATGPGRTPDDRRRGAQYKLVLSAALGSWEQGLSEWARVVGDHPFDRWLVAAHLAGYPAGDRAERMFAWARSLLEDPASHAPDFLRPPWEESRQAFRALVHRASLEGDSADVEHLRNRLRESLFGGHDRADPLPEVLAASLEARLHLLAHDTASAISFLRRATSRGARPLEAYYPLANMAPQRYLLAELLEARGEPRAADRFYSTFFNDLSLGSMLYLEPIRASRRLAGPPHCGPGSER